MSESLKLTIAYEEPDEQGLVLAWVVGVPGAHGSGHTRAEAREEAIEAMRFMLEEPTGGEHGEPVSSESLELLIGP
jgi:predicted RNase H-like HicB family nuclease